VQLINTVLITGGTGFLGQNLARRLSQRYRVVLGARNNDQNRRACNRTGCYVKPLDVTNIESVRDSIREVRPDLIIHAAATKHVDLSEREPLECVDVNVRGSENVARVAIDAGVSRVLAISTDKAAPPVQCIYGMTKALMERLFCGLDAKSQTRFGTLRFGNIAWSTGSVFPLWKEMQARDGHIRSTGPHMRRYFFGIADAVALVETAIDNFELVGGRVLSCDVGAAQILDIWTKLRGGSWGKVGERPGDSVDQWLIGESEVDYARRIRLKDKDYFLIDFRDKGFGNICQAFSSANARRLTESEIGMLLIEPLE
jgi:UDP-glucose 4-epimerase